jgi:hypothetical protein
VFRLIAILSGRHCARLDREQQLRVATGASADCSLRDGIRSAATVAGARDSRRSTGNGERAARHLAMADVLSGGRLQPGFSAGTPPHAELIGDLVFDGDWRGYDLSYGRIERLIDNLRGHYLGETDTVIHSPGNTQRPRLQRTLRGWSIGSGTAAGAPGRCAGPVRTD